MVASQPIILTATEREILQSYSAMLEGLANYLGESFEFVLHSLEDYKHSVIQIINGSHTGRGVGSPITDLALSMLEKTESENVEYINYFSKNKKGEPLKSTTITIRGEKNRVIGLLCINMYLNTPLSTLLESLIDAGGKDYSRYSYETFFDSSDDLIESTLASIKEEVYEDRDILQSNRNKEIVYRLDDYGVFQIKDSVIKVADLLGISKNTVYMHIRNKNQKEKQDSQLQL